jgi:hypothetical protein
MNDQYHLITHDWSNIEPREIKIEGKSIFHHHCRKCGRDFARESSQADWKAVYIGPFAVKFLDDSVSQQWVSEPCPGTPPPMVVVATPWKKRLVQRRR